MLFSFRFIQRLICNSRKEGKIMGELINLDDERRRRWADRIRRMRTEMGGVAVFGVIGEQNAQIIYLPSVEMGTSNE